VRAVDYGLIKASQRLSELDIRIGLGGYAINVYWFRVMFKDHDWFIRRHAHSTFEFHFIARGDCEVVLDGSSFFADTGTLFLCAPNVFHAQKPGRSPELVEYSLNCDIRRTGSSNGAPGGEIEWLHSVLVNTPCAPTADTCGAFPLIETALREADQRRPGFELTIRNLVIMILIAVARAMGVPDASARTDGASSGREPADSRMVRIEQFVTDNIRLDLSPRDIAEFLGLSERQVARVVRCHKGYATKKFITRTRLRKAKGLLCTTDLTLKEIAEELGFSNEYYFNSVFKKHEGFPPGLFRESMRNHPGGNGPVGAGPASVSGNDKSAYEFRTGEESPGAPQSG
jgi:AraC-like DNA-binding protein